MPTKTQSQRLPLVTEVLEKCKTTLAGLPLWKAKEVELNPENISENVFVLSTDLAAFFGVRHNNFLKRNISKLQSEKYLPDHLLTCEQMVEIGSTAQASQKVYALKPNEIEHLAIDIVGTEIHPQKISLLKILQTLETELLQSIDSEDVEEVEEIIPPGTPMITDVLEIYQRTPEGIRLWKMKDVTLTLENVLEKVFILSNELADYFRIRHSHLIHRNIEKLQKERQLPEHLHEIVQMFPVGNDAQVSRLVYMLTRHQTERLIMDFSGPRARQKKFAILNRLQAIGFEPLAE
jgi:phage regulator Rha-like protein